MRHGNNPRMNKLLDQEEIGRRIALVRKMHGGLSQDAFAKTVGINRATLANYEQGNNRPRIDHGAAICVKYNLTLDWLYLGRAGGMRLQDLETLGLSGAQI